MGTINGNQNPEVGMTNFYEISILNSLPFLNPKGDVRYEWYLFKRQKSGRWIDITRDGAPKKGVKVSYKFFEAVMGKLFEIRVYEIRQGVLPTLQPVKNLFGKLQLRPVAGKTVQIEKVVLFNRGKRVVNKASYRDILIVQAFCTGLFGKEIEFQLWEDDATGEGHNPLINKGNRIPKVYKATVNEKGIAEAKISLSADERVMRRIANRFLMRGDQNEGIYHEYYVTATYLGTGEKASQVNVNVTNPDNNNSNKIGPRANSAKFPVTPISKIPKQPDAKGKILDACFINVNGQKVSRLFVNDWVKIRITSQNMTEKRVQYVIWEYDAAGHDEILRKDIILTEPTDDTPTIKIDPAIFGKGYSTNGTIFGKTVDDDCIKQNYFIEVIPMDVSAESKRFGLDHDGLLQVEREKVKSAAMVKDIPRKYSNNICVCKEEYKNLVWGSKVSCEFRKKVIEICKDLWPNMYFEMANGLMAVMYVETRGSFKAQQLEGWKSIKNPKEMTIKDFWKNGMRSSSRAVGLIQFTQEALQKNLKEYISNSMLSTEQKFDELNKLKLSYAQMGEINQLDKVKKYFESQKNSIKTPGDIYLAVFAPKGVDKKDDYILYKGGTIEFNANSSVDTKSNGNYKNDGNIQRAEILERYYSSLSEGQGYKLRQFDCNNSAISTISKVSLSNNKEMLSIYLSYAQAIKSDAAKRNGLNNIPSISEKENLKHLGINIFDKIYVKFNGNVKVTSVFRSEAVNKKVGGSSTSQHRYGQALDIQGINGVTNRQIFKYVKDNLDYHQIIWEYGTSNEPDWVHIGYKSSGNKKINTRAIRVNGKTKYKTLDILV